MLPRQPNSRHCFVCGVANPFGLHLKFEMVAPGEVVSETIIPLHYQGYPGVVHGGIVAAMLDELAARAHMGIQPPRFLFTGKLEIRYRKNVPVGEPLRLVGKAGRTRRNSAEATSFIYGPGGDLLAEADALLFDVPSATVEGTSLDALGWQVYPDEEIKA